MTQQLTHKACYFFAMLCLNFAVCAESATVKISPRLIRKVLSYMAAARSIILPSYLQFSQNTSLRTKHLVSQKNIGKFDKSKLYAVTMSLSKPFSYRLKH